jgi:transcriptional regulator with XRE-family HTH domain
MGRKIDWEKVEAEYITSDISQKELAKKYGVSPSTLSGIASKGKWFAKRKKHRGNVIEKAVRKTATTQSRVMAKEIRLMNSLEKHLDKALRDADQFNRHIVSEGTGNGVSVTEERIYNKTDMRALKDAVSAARELERMRRSLFGYLTEQEKQQLAMARERLEIDKQKVDYSEGDTEVTIRFSDNADEWSN